jgi:hypothetical protein
MTINKLRDESRVGQAMAAGYKLSPRLFLKRDTENPARDPILKPRAGLEPK